MDGFLKKVLAVENRKKSIFWGSEGANFKFILKYCKLSDFFEI